MSVTKAVLASAKAKVEAGSKPGAALGAARQEIVPDAYAVVLQGYEKWESHVGKKVLFMFGRTTVEGTVEKFDRDRTLVVISYRFGRGREATFRGTLKQLGKVVFLED